MNAVDVLAVMDREARQAWEWRFRNEDRAAAHAAFEKAKEARAAVAELIAALENSDAWIREMRIQHGLQATATLDQNRAALARCTGEGA